MAATETKEDYIEPNLSKKRKGTTEVDYKGQTHSCPSSVFAELFYVRQNEKVVRCNSLARLLPPNVGGIKISFNLFFDFLLCFKEFLYNLSISLIKIAIKIAKCYCN